MEFVAELAKYFLAKSDPMPVVCFLVLAIWQHRTSKTLQAHLNPDVHSNPHLHPQCREHESTYKNLLGQIHENRKLATENHRETREEIKGLSDRIDLVLKIAVDKREADG